MAQDCHIFYQCELFNPGPIWMSLREHAEENRWDAQEIIKALSNSAISIDVRWRIVRAAVSYSRKRIKRFLSSIKANQLANEMAYPDESLTYELLFSVGSVIFESHSLKELLQKFYVGLLRKTKLAKNNKTADQDFFRLVAESENNVGFVWNEPLGKIRDFFIHESAPYPRIRYTSLKKNDRSIVIEHTADSEDILTLPEIDTYLRGLEHLSDLCVQDIIRRISPPSA